MRRLVIWFVILPAVFSIFPRGVFADEGAADRFEKVIERMVKAINDGDYAGIQRDFGQVMLDAFPQEKSEPFFRNLSAQYGKIQRLDSAQLIPPVQAVFPAHCERGILDIKVVLDDQDKIIGLWFLPHTPRSPAAEKDKTSQLLPATAKPQETAADVKVETADANAAVDPNVLKDRLKKGFEPLENALKNVNKESRKEIREWMRGTVEDRLSLVKVVQKQVMAEYDLIRKLAVEEGAVKTTKAIDRLIADRRERFEKMLEKMEEANEKMQRRGTRGRERDPKRRSREDRSKKTRRSRTQDVP